MQLDLCAKMTDATLPRELSSRLAEIRAIALDRDGTINVDVGYPHRIEDLAFLDGFFEFMAWAKAQGLPVFVTTNQAGIGRGYYDLAAAHAFNDAISAALAEKGLKIERFELCPHHPDDNCSCRKPNTGMLESLARDTGIDGPSWIVFGDKPSDVEFAKRFGALAVQVGTEKAGAVAPDLRIDHLGMFPEIFRCTTAQKTGNATPQAGGASSIAPE